MAAIIEEVPVNAEPAAQEAPEANEVAPPEAKEAAPALNTPIPKAKGRPKGAKDNTIRRRRPPPPPPSTSSEEEEPEIATIPDMRTRKQRMFDAWFD
jgi:hypothetical protein